MSKDISPTPRIVYILTKLELGGAQKICLSLMQGLRKQSVGATLISGPEGPLVTQTKEFDSVYLLESFKREVSISGIILECRNFIKIIWLLKQLKKQYGSLVVHTHSTKAGIVGRWAAFFAGIKQRVHTIHGYGFHDHQSWPAWLTIYGIELITSLITTHFICVSQKDQQTGIKLFPSFSKKNSLIRAAVDSETFSAPAIINKVDNTFIIGTVVCFKPQKNIFDLLQAFKLVHETCLQKNLPLPQLQIIGDGQLRHEIETWINHAGLNNVITLLGWRYDVATIMQSWHLFALSSLWEGLPCSIVEARLSKLPVVSYNIGGIPDVIFNNKNGYLIPPKDWRALANKIIEIIQNPSLLRELSMYNDQLDDFNNTTMINKHLMVYNNLVGNFHHSR